MAQLLGAWSLHYSLSLQQTLYAMAQALLQNVQPFPLSLLFLRTTSCNTSFLYVFLSHPAQQPGVAAVRLSLPNKHHFPVDMSPFGLPNDNTTFIAADRPYGLIEAVVNRQGACDAPVDLWPSWGQPRKTAIVKSKL